ncbi:hypothetical protein HS7_12500 [Sulfolobales archaeon HS-7]|nr:hypothetical protein HS7_12500 [Sulfolobales archaeon HS-7]
MEKLKSYIRISRRSGVLVQRLLYYYSDNLYEDIVVFKKPVSSQPKKGGEQGKHNQISEGSVVLKRGK